jgi:hypothetical protein
LDERLGWGARGFAGEPTAELCREFGISRKTGYKIFDRYQDCGVEGLTAMVLAHTAIYLLSRQSTIVFNHSVIQSRCEPESWRTA